MIKPFSVVIVNYNTRELLRACLRAVLSESPSEVVVVDNASSDGSAEMVRTEFPSVTLHRNEVNLGYGAAANQAVTDCSAKYVLLLNSDAIPRPGALQALGRYLDQNPRAAVAGPRLANLDGTLQTSCLPFPTPLDILLDVSNSYRLIRHIPILRNHVLRTWPHDKARPVPWVLGAALAIRREAFEAVGGFDPSFFLYYEEVDLCYRLAKSGWQVHFAPVTDILHVGGASSQQRRTDMAVQLFMSLAQFYRRHYSGAQFMELTVLLEFTALARLMRDLILTRLVRDPWERATLAENTAAWRRLLLGHWRRSRKRGGVCSIGLIHEYW